MFTHTYSLFCAFLRLSRLNELKKRTPPALSLLSVTVLLLSSGCAWFATIPPSPPLSPQVVAAIVSAFQEQGSGVETLFSSGTLTLETQGAQSEATALIVASRDPSHIKIEITHPWGQPLLHILVNGSRLDILSFSEKRRYYGDLGSCFLLKSIPFPLDADLLWSLARAYPMLPPYHHARSLKGDQITLMDQEEGNIQVIDLYPDSKLPRRVWFCREEAAISFSDFQGMSGMAYAREIRLSDDEDTTRLTLDIRQMVFNRPVPAAIFQQAAPPGFEAVPLATNDAERSGSLREAWADRWHPTCSHP